METKVKRLTNYIKKTNKHPILELYLELVHLKQLFRQGWLKRNVAKEFGESVADHVFSVCVLSFLIAEEYFPELDPYKVLRLALIHDIGEIYAGDITPVDGVSLEEKRQLELAAVKKVFSKFSKSTEYIGLWQEYENQSSEEAIFVTQIDKLEMGLQALVYEHHGHTQMSEFLDHMERVVTSPKLLPLIQEIKSLRKEKDKF